MLPPNAMNSINNLTRAGILDYGTAAYVSGMRADRYSRLMNPYCNPYGGCYYPYDTFTSSYMRRTFWQKIGNLALILGGTYLGGKVFLRAAQGIKGIKASKNVTNAAGQEVKGGIRKFFSKIKNAFRHTPNNTTEAATSAAENGAIVTSRSRAKLSIFFDKIKSKFGKGVEDFTGMTKRVFKNGRFRPGF